MTPETVKGLKKSYLIAVESEALDFEFMGAEFDTRYAKFLIEFYEDAFKGVKQPKEVKEPVEEVKKTSKRKK